MLLDYLTLATDVEKIESSFHYQFLYSFTPIYRFSKGMNLPVITSESEKSVITCPWGMQVSHTRPTSQRWTFTEGILKNRATRALIRTRRCVVLTNCFFIKNRGNVLLFYKPLDPVLCLGGIWNLIKKPGGLTEYGFTILTRPAPSCLSPFTDRVPVIISRSRQRGFLNTAKPLMDISWIFRETYYPELNGYKINSSILKKDAWNREDLLPAGNKIFARRKQIGAPVVNTRNYFWR